MASVIRAGSLRAMVAGMVLACGGGGDGGGITNPPTDPTNPPTNPPSGSATVVLGASSFSPSSVTITRNGTVTWNNTSGVLHNVTFAAATGAPSNIDNHSSGSNARSFGTAGTFNYSCTLHGGMNGSVVVQ
jgi:plastocyanin